MTSISSPRHWQHRHSARGLCTAIMLATGMCSWSYAEGPPEQSPLALKSLFELSLEELQRVKIRSASLFPESKWSAASTVSRVTENDWRQRGARRLTDAIETLPGTVPMPFRFGANAVVVRGFASSNLPRGLSVMLDGVPLTGFSNGSALVTLPDVNLGVLGNVEMVRGPASALYGSDAFLGVLSLQSIDAERTSDRVLSELGSNGYYHLDGHASHFFDNSAIASASLATSGQGQQDISYQYTHITTGAVNTGQRDNEYDTQSGVIKLSAPVNDALTYRFGVYWNSVDASRFPGAGRSQSSGRSVLAGEDWSGSNADFKMTNASVTQLLANGITAELNGFYWQSDVLQQTKVPRSDNTIGENEAEIGDTRYGTHLIFRQRKNPWNTQWAFAFGHDTMRVHEGHLTSWAADGTLLNDADEPYNNMERSIDSAQAEAKTRFFDNRLFLVYGGRLDFYDDFGTQHMPRGGIIFQPNSNWVYKLLHGKAFRAPTAFELTGIGNFKGNPALDPETVATTEAVIMTAAVNWWAGLTFFYSEWQQGIVRVPSTDPNFRLEFQNIDSHRSQGVETQLHYSHDDWWADFNATYTDSQNTTSNNDYDAFPHLIVNAGIGYRASRDLRFYLNNRLYLDREEGVNSATARYDELPTYWRMDLNATQNVTERMQVFVNIRNLLDRENEMPTLFSAENGIPEEPASISAGFRYTLQ